MWAKFDTNFKLLHIVKNNPEKVIALLFLSNNTTILYPFKKFIFLDIHFALYLAPNNFIERCSIWCIRFFTFHPELNSPAQYILIVYWNSLQIFAHCPYSGSLVYFEKLILSRLWEATSSFLFYALCSFSLAVPKIGKNRSWKIDGFCVCYCKLCNFERIATTSCKVKNEVGWKDE